VGRAIATTYGSSSERKQQYFGRVDPFCAFAVVPLLIVAGLFFWSEIPLLGTVLVVLSILIVVIDSWANRPARTGTRPSRGDA
jgi:Na+/melibiose symporter-like transporter